QMGGVMVGGGVIGSGIGALLFNFFQSIGQIDVVINVLYVVLLGSIGSLMLREAITSLRASRSGIKPQVAKRRHHPLVAVLPLRWRFYRSGLYISPLAPLLLGMGVGILTMLMGVGGGFILVPAMLYILGMSANVVVGTSLFQILFTTMITTMMHALTTHAVDVVLAALLLLGSVSGAQIGTKIALTAKPEMLRLVLAATVLLIALRMLYGLSVRPDEIFTVTQL
ncbi:MAG: sulfite exporter TauE/SafE family protein, partial [Sphingomonadales bacterium]|nr:sulfite exporter TauE/SafE family protein [Sphingomonadales bacterium]